MIKIKPIASGSSGNCYYVSDGNSNILLDCGIPVQKIKEFLWNNGKKLSDIDACLVTHSHKDHCKSAQKLADIGIKIFASVETCETINIKKNTQRIRTCGQINDEEVLFFDIGKEMISIIPLPVEHDAKGTLSFAIFTDCERILYITDTPFFQYNVKGITHLMIEANNDSQIISKNVINGKIRPEHAKRVVQNHMSIETCLKTIERMDRSKLKEIWLLHLSKDNAGDDFKRRAQELAGVEVYVA